MVHQKFNNLGSSYTFSLDKEGSGMASSSSLASVRMELPGNGLSEMAQSSSSGDLYSQNVNPVKLPSIPAAGGEKHRAVALRSLDRDKSRSNTGFWESHLEHRNEIQPLSGAAPLHADTGWGRMRDPTPIQQDGDEDGRHLPLEWTTNWSEAGLEWSEPTPFAGNVKWGPTSEPTPQYF
jgi:hypothetical protein